MPKSRALLFLFAVWACTPAPRPPNVLLVTVDCLRADRAEAGREIPDVNPNLSRFLSGSASFRRALVVSPWTLPSLTTLVRSQYPIEHGAIAVNPRSVIARAAPGRTLAEVLAANGYRTGTFLAHGVVLEPERNIVAGFADRNPGLPTSFRGKLTAPAIDRAFRRWVRAGRDRPFFAWLHYMELHAPPTEGNPHLGKIRPPYDAEMRYVDDSFGRVRRFLEKSGEWDRTIVVFTSDHGEELGDHLAGGHQHTLFDELLRVPLAIRIPGEPTGVVDAQIELIDVAPTIVDALGLAPEPAFRGTSRLGWIRGEPAETVPSFAARYFCRGHHLFSTTIDGWKLIGFVPYEGVRSRRPSTIVPARFPDATRLEEVATVVDETGIVHRLDWTFSDEIELAGYRLRRSRLAEDQVYLDLDWRAGPRLSTLPERTVFLRGPNGDGAQVRSLLADGDVPVRAWREGVVVRETVWMRAPERFEVVLGGVTIRGADDRGPRRLVESASGRDRHLVLGAHRRDELPFPDGAPTAEAALVAARGLAREWTPDAPGTVWKLYDLRNDPEETENLYWSNPEAARRGKAALREWQKAQNRRERVAIEPDASLSGEQEERLRSLGYLQ